MPENAINKDIWNSGEYGWLCDFCHIDGGLKMWFYVCKGFVMQPVPGNAAKVLVEAGTWGACEDCHLLIDADDYAGLVRLASLRQPGEPELVELVTTRLHNLFRANRIGDPTIQYRVVGADGKAIHAK